ncbi:MAG: hypothetical protein J0M12_12260 [Deltaproteobacteria bacterium]|nr:hypothetical protein [Deltaproteobacteria bacterium]
MTHSGRTDSPETPRLIAVTDVVTHSSWLRRCDSLLPDPRILEWDKLESSIASLVEGGASFSFLLSAATPAQSLRAIAGRKAFTPSKSLGFEVPTESSDSRCVLIPQSIDQAGHLLRGFDALLVVGPSCKLWLVQKASMEAANLAGAAS